MKNWRLAYSIIGIFLICGGLFFVPFGEHGGNATFKMGEVSATEYTSSLLAVQFYSSGTNVGTIDANGQTISIPEGTVIDEIRIYNLVHPDDFPSLTQAQAELWSLNSIQIYDPSDSLITINASVTDTSSISHQSGGWNVQHKWTLGNPLTVAEGTYDVNILLQLYI